MDKRYAIFDMDGTLADSMGYWDSLAEEYLHRRGVATVPPELLQRTMPLPVRETLELFIREYRLDDTLERAEKELYAVMEGHYRQDIRLKPGAREYLEGLARRGVIMGVASSTAEPLMELCLRQQGVRDLFQSVLSCESVGAGKDKPDIYHAAARRLGAPGPEAVAVFEDSLVAARTAKSAGYYLVGVYDRSVGGHWGELCALADETIEHW